MGQTRFASGRQLDLICLGRLGVDLYAQQVGARLEDVTSFAKYLGGSSANIAFGTARLGLKSAMLSRVGDDHMGASWWSRWCVRAVMSAVSPSTRSA